MPAIYPLFFCLTVSMCHDNITVEILTKWYNSIGYISLVDSKMNSRYQWNYGVSTCSPCACIEHEPLLEGSIFNSSSKNHYECQMLRCCQGIFRTALTFFFGKLTQFHEKVVKCHQNVEKIVFCRL